MSITEIGEHRVEYQKRMRAALSDKCSLFRFAPNNSLVLDYGSGAGDVARYLSEIRPDIRVIGFDRDEITVKNALKKGLKNAIFSNDEDWCFVRTCEVARPKVLFLSSVIHEMVTSFCATEFARVLQRAKEFDMVIIRDMCVSENAVNVPDAIPERGVMEHEFEEAWGELDNARNVSHFLLKSRYADNWEAEMRENYFALNREPLLDMLRVTHPVLIHETHTRNAFLDNELFKERGRHYLIPTHIELVAKRIV